MGLVVPTAWRREVLKGRIIWTATIDATCYNCGKIAKVKAIVDEGEYNEELWEKIGKDGKETDIYPTLAPPPNSEMQLIFPDDGWSMMCHLTRNFFPFETCQAIRMGCEPYAAFLHWYRKVGTQFGEWICPNDECFVETARSLKKEFNSVMETAKDFATKGQ